jgi:hypothetical protein
VAPRASPDARASAWKGLELSVRLLFRCLRLLPSPPGRENKKEGSKFTVIQVLSVSGGGQNVSEVSINCMGWISL